jgi:hypothetical protein
MNKNQEWYSNVFLHSNHWHETRNKVYKNHPHCQICGRTYDLIPHHISYKRLGTKDEYKDIRMVCRKHHKMCHRLIWIILLPRTTFWLTWRYYDVKINHMLIGLLKSYRIGRQSKVW